ncbi:MAG: 16S rRNA (guanine(966)-N(2))-methyltransferase RsmD [Candidatus Pelagibacter sp.]|tara:strand:- start:2 stop:562 length:561 start_codon:yes stop_codon:yes gene_type:complete
MRIIGGNLKGKKILIPKDDKTRPLRDLVKESIFNLILHSNKFNCSINDSNILDLFSGTGSFGLECISRNSKMITFFENHNEALYVLKKNINSLNVENKCRIIEEDCFEFFKTNKPLKEKFDIIFIDPPYREIRINFLINLILEKKILKNNGILIIHRHKKDNVNISDKLKILDQRIYGISKIVIGN